MAVWSASSASAGSAGKSDDQVLEEELGRERRDSREFRLRQMAGRHGDRHFKRVQEAADEVIYPDKVDHVRQALEPEGLLGRGIQVGVDPAFE